MLGKKVKFIDESLSGVITRIISPEEVIVRVGDWIEERAYTFQLMDYNDQPLSLSVKPIHSRYGIVYINGNTEEGEEDEDAKDDVILQEVKVIDLHLDTPHYQMIAARMNQSQKKEFQLKEVRRVLDESEGRTGREIIFIHGKGTGALRQEIRYILGTEYPNYKFEDADWRRYGEYGATLVTVT